MKARDPTRLVGKTEYELSIWDDGEEEVNHFGGYYEVYRDKFQAEETESKPSVRDEGEEEEEYPLVDYHEVFHGYVFDNMATVEEIYEFVEEDIKPYYDAYEDELSSVKIEIDDHMQVRVIQLVLKEADYKQYVKNISLLSIKEKHIYEQTFNLMQSLLKVVHSIGGSDDELDSRTSLFQEGEDDAGKSRYDIKIYWEVSL